MRKPLIITGSELLQRESLIGKKVLLISPPVYDIRLEWSRWHQPEGLLQIATLLKKYKKDVRLIDCLYHEPGRRLVRHKIDAQEIELYKFDKWHFGLSFDEFETRLDSLVNDYWIPNTVLVTCLNSIWWESARDTIKRLKQKFPAANIVLGGAYATIAPDHAAQFCGADAVVIGSIPEAAKKISDLSLYNPIPYYAGINFYRNPSPLPQARSLIPRSLRNFMKEILHKAELGVREFVFLDEEISVTDRETFGELLDRIALADIDAHFVLPGNVPPSLITQDLARKMGRARVDQIYLRCDLRFGLEDIVYGSTLTDYERCVEALVNHGGYKTREGNLAAMLVVGLPYEDLGGVSERLICLAHIVGSVILVPFQYVPGLHSGALFQRALTQNGHFGPETFNSKLFPFGRLSGNTLEDYMELTRLAALLNSKYRSKTFDFLGDNLAARLFRESLRTGAWNPFVEHKMEIDEADTSLAAIIEGFDHDRSG